MVGVTVTFFLQEPGMAMNATAMQHAARKEGMPKNIFFITMLFNLY
jgi:hypothetical protein